MTIHWLLLAALVLVFSALRRRLRRQGRVLDRQITRLDHFAAENRRQRRRDDRESDMQSQPIDSPEPGSP